MLDTVGFDTQNNCLVIIDQTLLPSKTELLRLDTLPEIVEAIRSLRVRGAPAIGVSAAIAAAVLAEKIETADYNYFRSEYAKISAALAASRPTAVNLFWALGRCDAAVAISKTISAAKSALKKTALNILYNDIETCRKIGEYGFEILKPYKNILTHCNAGRLAAVRYGTALAPIYFGAEMGHAFHVYADETRPLLQGARLTAYELSEAGIETTVVCDNMAATLMSKKMIDAVIVGADRIAANGDTANKIGTLGLAVLAKHYDIPFYVAAPLSTIDVQCVKGAQIPIEQRAASEIGEMWFSKKMTPDAVSAFNPAFDVTPAELISAIITDGGAFKKPFSFSREISADGRIADRPYAE